MAAAVAATSPKPAASNPGIASKTAKEDPAVEREYLKILAADNLAQAEVDGWIKEAHEFAATGSTLSQTTLKARIEQRFKPVRQQYQRFIEKNPRHVAARLAYGSFLMDIHEEEAAEKEWEKAREVDPSNPAAWNNLANHFGHRGPIMKAFEYYQKAIELNPREPVYHQNFATTVYLFRKDAIEFFKFKDEQEVFDKALSHYRQALKLSPEDFPLASDLAQTYYGIRPPRYEEALEAWRVASGIARDDMEREGVELHLARWQINNGKFAIAQNHLNSVTNSSYQEVKRRLLRTMEERKKKAAEGSGSSEAEKANR